MIKTSRSKSWKTRLISAIAGGAGKTCNTTTIVVPMVVVALGEVIPKHFPWLSQIPGKLNVNRLHKCALLVTGKILRRFLKLPGFW